MKVSKRLVNLIVSILTIVLIIIGYFMISQRPSKRLPQFKGKKLLVYVAFNEDEAKVLLDGFKEKTGCDYSFLRFPTEKAAENVVKEIAFQKADVFLGGTADAIELLKLNGCLAKYVVKDTDKIPLKYRDPDGYWTGLYVEPLSIGINEERWNKEFKGIKKPTTMEELLNPAFKGEIVLPDPRTSGTGYTFLSYLVQNMGKEKALTFFKKLRNNVGQFTDSGFTPAKKVGVGEYLITVNFINQQLIVNSSGFKIQSIVPKNCGWTICPVAKIKNSPNEKVANAFIEYCTTKEARRSLKDFSMAIPTIDDNRVKKDVKVYKLSDSYNFNRAAKDRKYLLDELKKIM
ncbi:iron ABC transporter [Clostridium botulinum]|uniref:Iron ABC transporter n=1 Tax=Clostridium botulinum C/D str. DC5 TaxID=1443128 RepID=A0A0A0IJH0_CLOBO|nr:ABC transporter substrate-binding protein [Clostridium botulinum]KEI06930.1 iron ABC transporter [Clostridium botulinum C/D str. BKT75002]KEI08226.1 iron ABC transporter [Clostridium botulinum C/D str. BKT2873]KGM95735.1 iron ABC transporter [Clostridium botulinum D str. CCUG 7971]KGN00422.1 iron ABC transporter [Clostridium botulinum C/D str. DC5]KOC48018.1 iron ABC transporter [Clostridium botulinum]